MKAKTKWIGGAAFAVVVILAIVLVSRGDDSGSSEKNVPTVEPAAPAVAPAAPGVQEPAPATDAGPVAATGPIAAVNMPPPVSPLPYRPAKYLIYSDAEVSEEPDQDRKAPVLARIIDVANADSSQAEKIRSAWRTHEDARRELWKTAFPRLSGPRILDSAELAQIDFVFQTALLGNILRPEQAKRLIEELPPVQPPQQPKVYPNGGVGRTNKPGYNP